MRLTVILCTFNRFEALGRALDSVAASVMPESAEWEVLIVDNNSSDQTRNVAERFCKKYPERFRYIFEPRQGKSFALNTGIREAEGEVLAFLDDDVRAEPTWLYGLTSPLRDTQWAGSGGRILPEPGFTPPPWLALHGPRSFGAALCAKFDFGDDPGQLKDAPFGTNMAYRKEMFEKYGGFREDLGPLPGGVKLSEDTEFGRRLMTSGERLCYAPSAVVYHEVHKNRVRKEFFLKWWFDRGRAKITEDQRSLGIGETIVLAARAFRSAIGSVLSFSPERRFYRKCMARYAAGQIVESRRLDWMHSK